MKISVVDAEFMIEFAFRRHAIEAGCHYAVCRRVQRAMKNFRLLEYTKPVVGAAGQIVNDGILLDQFDGRNKLGPLQAIFVQLIGWDIGRRHQGYAVAEQVFEQAGEQHGVRDIRYMELIKAKNAAFFCPVSGDPWQRVAGFALLLQVAVNALHKAMKMDALFSFYRQIFVKKVHQPGFATPNTSPDVKSPDVFWPMTADSIQNRWLTLSLEGMPQIIQGFCNFDLSRVRLKFILPGERVVLPERGGFR